MSRRTTALTLATLALLAASPALGAGPYPEAVAWSPTGTGVPLDAVVAIGWSMRMDPMSVQAAFGMTDGVSTWGWPSFAFSHSGNPPFTTTATPLFPLTSLTTYTVVVAPTAREFTRTYPLDQDGDGVGGEPEDALVFAFTTEDADPPRVAWTRPVDGATGVPVGIVVEIGFSEAMDPMSAAAFAIAPSVEGTFGWGGSGTRLTFDPSLNLAYGTRYDVRVNGTKARDVAGNPLDGDGDGVGGDDFAFSFTTEADVAPPTVLSVAPAPGSTAVSVTANLEVRFSETMNRTSVEAALTYSDGTTTWGRAAGAFAWRGVAFADDAVRFNPHANLPFLRTITVRLNASVAADPAGFLLDGNGDGRGDGSPTDDVTWAFTTEAADTTPPKVLAVNPPDGATDVPTSTAIRITFTEMMNRTSVEDAFSLGDGVRTWTKADGTFAWEPGDEEVRYAPSTNLAFRRGYTVRIAGTATDVNGNPLDGNGDGAGGDPWTSAFETGAQPDTVPPHVVGTIPRDGATDVDRVPLISITFDDGMDRAATEGAIALAAVDPATEDLLPVPIAPFEWSAADHTVSFRPAESLDWGTDHRVTVSQAAKDDAGWSLERAFTFSFRTVAWKGTVVGRVVDASGGVAGATVTLGERTTQTSATGAFEMPNVQSGTYNLTVSKAGYETARTVVAFDHADVDPGTGAVDLGTFTLARAEGVSPFVLLGILAGVLLGALGVGVWLRRRRTPPWERFDAMDEEYAEFER